MKLAIPLLLLALIGAPLVAQSNKAWLGASLQLVEKEDADKLGIPGGLKVLQVVDNSPAQDAGLEAGDIILSAGEHTITSIEKMREVLTGMKPGDFLSLGVRRTNGRNEPLVVTLGTVPDNNKKFEEDEPLKELREKLRDLDAERRKLWDRIQERLNELRGGKAEKEAQPAPAEPAEPEPAEPPPPEPKTVEPERVELKVTIGASGETLKPEDAKELGIQAGLRITRIHGGSAAEEAGLQKGDIVTHVDDETVTGTGDLRTILARHQAGDRIELTVLRKGEKVNVTLMLRAK
jgi:S1-C subfamily serine protease